MGGSAAALPEGCFAIFRKLRNLAKDAHRGRNGTSCPAMTPLRFCGGSHRPHAPMEARCASPQFWGKKFLQSILRAVQSAHPASRGRQAISRCWRTRAHILLRDERICKICGACGKHTGSAFAAGDFGCGPATAGAWGRREPPQKAFVHTLAFWGGSAV